MRKLNLIKATKELWPKPTAVVNNIFMNINKALLNKETVSIGCFGKFKVVRHKNGKLKIKFNPSQKIVDKLNKDWIDAGM